VKDDVPLIERSLVGDDPTGVHSRQDALEQVFAARVWWSPSFGLRRNDSKLLHRSTHPLALEQSEMQMIHNRFLRSLGRVRPGRGDVSPPKRTSCTLALLLPRPLAQWRDGPNPIRSYRWVVSEASHRAPPTRVFVGVHAQRREARALGAPNAGRDPETAHPIHVRPALRAVEVEVLKFALQTGRSP
jgi:hypothetical protein